MTERPSSKDFERHPDVRTLQGVGGPHHESMQAKLDLFLDAPVLTRIADVPVDNTLRIRSYLRDGQEEEVTFRRYPDEGQNQRWVLLREEGDAHIEEPVIMHGACAGSSGTLMEADSDNVSVRQHAYFIYAVAYPLRFRHGSEVPDTSYAHYKTPEEQVAPEVIAQYLASDDEYICRGADGLLYYNTIDDAKSYEAVTGEIFAIEIEPLA